MSFLDKMVLAGIVISAALVIYLVLRHRD